MFTNERLFTIQAFTITRVHCIRTITSQIGKNYCTILLFFSSANAASYHDPKSMPEAKPEVKKPEFVISGGPSIKQCEILNDKRHILTKDTENNVSLYDVLKARKVEDLGQVEFEQEVKKRLQVSISLTSFSELELNS